VQPCVVAVEAALSQILRLVADNVIIIGFTSKRCHKSLFASRMTVIDNQHDKGSVNAA
jgi:hypothetical protein